jgi:hypothetical protein
MKARIKKEDLVSFKIHASSIKRNPDLAVLDHLKIEIIGDYVSIMKSNLRSFAIQTTPNDSEDGSFLVDENVLFNFIELSDSDYINFDVSGVRVIIYDERNKATSKTEPVTIYPKPDVTNKEWQPINKLVLEAIGIAAQIVFDDEIQGMKNSVFIGEGAVAGSDGSIAFWRMFKKEEQEHLPRLVLRKEVAMSVSKLNGCEISENASYNLFKSGSVLFGFSKTEVPFVNLPPVFGNPTGTLSFNIFKSALIKWNTFCINTFKSKVLSAEFTAEATKLNLELVDANYGRESKSHIDIVEGSGYFKFNPSTLNMLLKVLPSDNIYFYPGPNRYYITDNDKSFMSAIMLII